MELNAGGGVWPGLILLRQTGGESQRVGVASSYAGARLHGVPQITNKEAGLIFSLVAAGQLSQALEEEERQEDT